MEQIPRARRLASMTLFLALGALLVTSIGALAFGSACSGGSTEVEPVADPDPQDPQPQASPGVVETPPVGSRVVNVQLTEWSVVAEPVTVAAGEVYFLAANEGDEVHELVVVRTDEEPNNLPVADGAVVESALVDLIGEIEGFAAGTDASGLFELEPGSYVLLCNIVEEEGGKLESHYQQGMYTAFTVE